MPAGRAVLAPPQTPRREGPRRAGVLDHMVGDRRREHGREADARALEHAHPLDRRVANGVGDLNHIGREPDWARFGDHVGQL
jgi:hypothetical protein